MKIAVLIGGILYDSQKSLPEGIMDYAKEEGANVVPNTIQNESVVEDLQKKLASLSVPVLSMDAKPRDFVSFEADNQKRWQMP